MSNELRSLSNQTLESVILKGDLSSLNSAQKVEYIVSLCNRVGLDPATQPFKLLKLNGKEIPYADRSCAAQLNQLHGLSHQITDTQKDADSILMIDRCTGKDGRFTEEVGAVSLTGLKGEALANAIMKCRTKAMRRATLTHVGLGMLDESEVDTIPGAKTVPVDPPAEYTWTEEDTKTATISVNGFGDQLASDFHLDEADIHPILAKPKSTIGDPTISPEVWFRRFLGYCDSVTKKHGGTK